MFFAVAIIDSNCMWDMFVSNSRPPRLLFQESPMERPPENPTCQDLRTTLKELYRLYSEDRLPPDINAIFERMIIEDCAGKKD
jgi:hypothetical protein